MDSPESRPEEGRAVPPAGNGSLAGHDEIPVAVPSAMFLAGNTEEDRSARARRPGEPATAEMEALTQRESVVVEAGPFGGLADLDAFERRLAALPAVASLRLRNFADAQASFDVALASTATPLQRQLREQLPEALVGLTPTGLRIDLGTAA